MKNVYLTIIKNKPLTDLIYQMELEGDVKGIQNAGNLLKSSFQISIYVDHFQ